MADNDQASNDNTKQDDKPTAPLLTPSELAEAKWQGDFKEEELTIPYKAEATDDTTSQNVEPKAEDKLAEDNTEEEPKTEEPEATYTEPEPVITTQDPGEYTPKDYSFEVSLKDGKTVKITTPEEAEAIAEDAENFQTPKQLLDFIRKAQKMENKLEQDREQWEAQKAQYDNQATEQNQRNETINTLASEFDYMVGKGLLPAIDPQYKDRDWTDPEVAKQPGVKEQIDLLNYMVRENELRTKAGVKPMTSVLDAYNAWKLEQNDKQAEDEEKTAAETRKAAGSRVSGVSASNQAPYVPKGIAVGNPNILRRGASNWED